MKILIKGILLIFAKIITSFKKIINSIIKIKENPIRNLARIFSNIPTCILSIMTTVVLIMIYIKNGISLKINMELSQYYYNNIFYATFFITILLAVIFVLLNNFKNGNKKKIIGSMLSIIICIIPAICVSYILLVQGNYITGNEKIANLITFNDRQNGITYLYIYSAITAIALLGSLICTTQWENVLDIIFGCAMFIVILPILLIIGSNIIAIVVTVITTTIFANIFGISFMEILESIGDALEEEERIKRKEKMAKKFVDEKTLEK